MMIIVGALRPLWLEFQLARQNHTNSYVKIDNANKTQKGRLRFLCVPKKKNAKETQTETRKTRSGNQKTCVPERLRPLY